MAQIKLKVKHFAADKSSLPDICLTCWMVTATAPHNTKNIKTARIIS